MTDVIDRAAQIIYDRYPYGPRWEESTEEFRDLYRHQARALADAGLLADSAAPLPIRPTTDPVTVTAEQLSEITRRYHEDAYVSNQDDITRWYAEQFGFDVTDPGDAAVPTNSSTEEE